MPFKRIEHRDLNMFYLLNADPREFQAATHDNLPQSRPFIEGRPTIVFIHAAGANVTSWVKQLSDPRLANNFNLFAVDARFHGFTTGGERKEHTLENSAECVLATLDEMNFESYHLFGEQVHGSIVATWIAAKRPEKVKSLLISSPGWRTESPDVLAALAAVEASLLVNKKGRGGDDTGTLPRGPLDDIVSYFIGSSVDRLADVREEMRLRIQSRYGEGKPEHDLKWLFVAVMDRKPIPQELMEKIECPVLILRGSEDLIVSPEAAVEEWRRSFSKARGGAACHVISGAPSLISMSDPNIVNRISMQFFRRSEGKD